MCKLFPQKYFFETIPQNNLFLGVTMIWCFLEFLIMNYWRFSEIENYTLITHSLLYSFSAHFNILKVKFSMLFSFIFLFAAKIFIYSWSSSILPRVFINSDCTLSSPEAFLGISLKPEFSLSSWE